LSKRLAEQVAGAVGELEDNVHEHSDAIGSGLVAFQSTSGCLEIVVLDRGVGVLASLRRSADYQHLESYEAALSAAVKAGATRYGRDTGRGTGFNRLFSGLADANSLLRFRSGDAVLELNGLSDKSRIPSNIAPRCFCSGFLTGIKVVA
jgi:hypothetical protein